MSLGKSIIILGVVLIIVGVIVTYRQHIPWIGRLPGDIYVKKENFTFYAPLMTSLLLSVIVSLVLYLFRK
jgi:uncharacterized protein HemY